MTSPLSPSLRTEKDTTLLLDAPEGLSQPPNPAALASFPRSHLEPAPRTLSAPPTTRLAPERAPVLTRAATPSSSLLASPRAHRALSQEMLSSKGIDLDAFTAKVTNSRQFKQLKKMLSQKNEMLKDLRKRLIVYEPDSTPVDDDDSAVDNRKK